MGVIKGLLGLLLLYDDEDEEEDPLLRSLISLSLAAGSEDLEPPDGIGVLGLSLLRDASLFSGPRERERVRVMRVIRVEYEIAYIYHTASV